MRKISVWAKNNKWPARFIIIGIYILLNILGIASGWLLNDLNIAVSVNFFLLFFILFLTGLIVYPLKRNHRLTAASVYISQKSCDLVLGVSTFCMIVYAGNNHNNLFNSYPAVNAAAFTVSSLPGDSTIKPYKSISAFKESMKDENGKSLSWKEKKKLLRKQIKEIKTAKDISPGGQVALIALSVLIALGLLYLLAALSCSISCSGAEGLAVVVAILGAGLIIFLLTRVIRGIIRNRDKEKPAKQNTATNS